MPEIQIKTEYRNLDEIAARLGKRIKATSKLIHRKHDPLPAKKVGRDYWMTEAAFQNWLNRACQ
jgi:hypothetical protein